MWVQQTLKSLGGLAGALKSQRLESALKLARGAGQIRQEIGAWSGSQLGAMRAAGVQTPASLAAMTGMSPLRATMMVTAMGGAATLFTTRGAFVATSRFGLELPYWLSPFSRTLGSSAIPRQLRGAVAWHERGEVVSSIQRAQWRRTPKGALGHLSRLPIYAELKAAAKLGPEPLQRMLSWRERVTKIHIRGLQKNIKYAELIERQIPRAGRLLQYAGKKINTWGGLGLGLGNPFTRVGRMAHAAGIEIENMKLGFVKLAKTQLQEGQRAAEEVFKMTRRIRRLPSAQLSGPKVRVVPLAPKLGRPKVTSSLGTPGPVRLHWNLGSRLGGSTGRA
jgi:hypothetical protein